jgi:Cft2 family RNA processing exonuclease
MTRKQNVLIHITHNLNKTRQRGLTRKNKNKTVIIESTYGDKRLGQNSTFLLFTLVGAVD